MKICLFGFLILSLLPFLATGAYNYQAKWNVEQENTKCIANIRRIMIDCLLVGGIIIILVPSLQFVSRLVRMLCTGMPDIVGAGHIKQAEMGA